MHSKHTHERERERERERAERYTRDAQVLALASRSVARPSARHALARSRASAREVGINSCESGQAARQPPRGEDGFQSSPRL